MSGGTWQPIETVPRDGSLIDVLRDGIRYTDCHVDQHGRFVRKQDYPAVTMLLGDPPTHWMPRPAGLIAPYETNQLGEKYVP